MDASITGLTRYAQYVNGGRRPTNIFLADELLLVPAAEALFNGIEPAYDGNPDTFATRAIFGRRG